MANVTPGNTFEATDTTLSYDIACTDFVLVFPTSLLSERQKDLIVRPPLRAAILKLPLLTFLRIVKIGHFGNNTFHVDPEQLTLLLAELNHHADGRPLPRGLVQRGGRSIVLLIETEIEIDGAKPRRDGAGQVSAKFFAPKVEIVLERKLCARERQESVRSATQPYLS